MALQEYQNASVAFNDLSKALPAGINLEEWKQQEQEALKNRGKYLKVFDVQLEKGTYIDLAYVPCSNMNLAPSQTALKAQLLQQPNIGNRAAIIIWIDQAIRLQEQQ
jgi:Lon protease-like protein